MFLTPIRSDQYSEINNSVELKYRAALQILIDAEKTYIRSYRYESKKILCICEHAFDQKNSLNFFYYDVIDLSK